MPLTRKEQKLAALMLDPAAPTGEYSNAAVKLAESLRRRGIKVDQLSGDRTALTQAEVGRFIMPFGKHRGKTLRDIDPAYLFWIVANCENKPEVVWAVERFLNQEVVAA